MYNFYCYFTNPNKQNEEKPPKSVCAIHSGNKALELIRLPQIFGGPDVISVLPFIVQTKKNSPTVFNKFTKTMRKNIFNYKEAVNKIYIDEEVSFLMNTDKLEKLMATGPNYRKPQSINF